MKRFLDVILSSLALLALAPLIAVICILIRLSMGGPVIFTQRRPGRAAQSFKMRKFRTMRVLDSTTIDTHTDVHRLTKLGRFLRSTSLDELPELWNILRGDMSLVGPRPLLEEYLPLYSDEQARRHDVRPGLTGWAQVHGRNTLDWTKRFELDVWYVDHATLLLDFRILLKTVLQVLRFRETSSVGHVTQSKFSGNSE